MAFARDVLRSNVTRQAGAGAKGEVSGDPAFTSVFYLDGEAHKRKRQAIVRFFTPKAISTRYRAVMEEATDTLLARLRARGQGRLDQMSFELAVTVAAEIVGLTNSDQRAMAQRIQATLIGLRLPQMSRWRRPFGQLQATFHGARFLARDVRPAIRARRAERREDVISHLLDEGYPEQAILIECITFAVAGMITTREFVVMAAWHLFGNDALRERFLSAEDSGQIAILEEIMRLDPVVNMIARRVTADMTTDSGSVSEGEELVIDIRAANLDAAGVGECPYALDPDRARRTKMAGSYLSFGDGSHRCPGAQVALNETRVFLDRLLRVPGIRLRREPDLLWTDELMGYELRNAVVTCDRA
ncbi:cytochrome P450 [Thermocatellispora tengchongensis]|uniref:Cytochrome P450 n=1 Tax=Thermocatellispora tengchongensis TaxID=1073253 RepID=A0A840PIV5_9ACTN|nr:cytochrome P450 [Thermocatellispora tengchongensis]MBB5137480.1 cytochrome P450 [Thermocatellispora tengchongensis]